MKLTLKIKLLPDTEQSKILLETLKLANKACDFISDIAFSKSLFNQFKLHKEAYYVVKGNFNLSAQMVIRCISKVADAYKIGNKIQRKFNPVGSIAYDSRIISYKSNNIVSIWSINGRISLSFICHNINYLPYIKGEADLVFKKGKFYLFQTVDVPEERVYDIEDFIGCDFGLTNIMVTSDGKKHSADWLNKYREQKQTIRSSIQRKGTRNSKLLLKRLTGKERTTATIINHTIAKAIVKSAKEQKRGIAIEDLTNIRFTSKQRHKKFRTKLGRWNFRQLRSFITYKAALSGVPLVVVNPAYTSQTCSICHYIGERKNKSFQCQNCGSNMDADLNASRNIATLGAAINQPERCDMYSCSMHFDV